MLYSEIIAVCSHIHTKHTNTLCGQNVPRSKHTPSLIKYQVSSLCKESEYLFFLRSTQIT
jgi:hypothetical protein